MLVKNISRQIDPISQVIASINGNQTSEVEVFPGVWEIGHFNFEHSIKDHLLKTKWPEFEGDDYRGSYGVCDNLDQILSMYPELEASDRKFVVSMTPILRESQSPEGGWRWHKWGRYIGTFESKCEYLYDEVGIDKVYCYHIYELH